MTVTPGGRPAVRPDVRHLHHVGTCGTECAGDPPERPRAVWEPDPNPEKHGHLL